MNKTEQFLASYFNKEFCCFTGSGTTAIYLLLKAINLSSPKIVFPAITCMAPVNSAMYAGYEPVFCDINLQNYTVDLNSLEAILQKQEAGIVVPTHLYGHKCDMEGLYQIAKKHNAFILEDAAQTVELSPRADASIISFGHTKIFQTQNGGGAVFTNDPVLYDLLVQERGKIAAKKENTHKLFDHYREIYYSIMKAIKKDPIFWELMLSLQKVSQDVFVYNQEENPLVVEILKRADEIIKKRQRRTELYDNYLARQHIKLPNVSCKDVRWRYSFLFQGDRDRLLEEVRRRRIDISSWYPSLHRMYSKQEDADFPNALLLEKQVINLWVDPNYEEKKIRNDVEQINEIMSICV